MNSNQNDSNPNTSNTEASSLSSAAGLDDGLELDGAPSSNDNAAILAIPDTTPLAADPRLGRYLRATLRRYSVPWQEMDDAVADVQVAAIQVARTKRMPAHLGEWKALMVTIAVRWAIDRLRHREVVFLHDAGPCEDPDAFLSPTLEWEERDPIDTKRYLAALKDLFDSGKMPEHGAEILWGVADGVPHEEIAAELGISRSTVDNRLFRMRVKFRTRLAALGMLTLMLLLAALFAVPLGGVMAPAPQSPPASSVDAGQAEDGGASPDVAQSR
jgi:DNA-directed RNA polymerase specialized sigma24 family protein